MSHGFEATPDRDEREGPTVIHLLCALTLGVCLSAGTLLAQESGTAKGKGVMFGLTL